ncbi:hypothetical protein [Frigidibacter sp. ROC022]|uniref:hypothetical protein n=1 Tax=Frigidibacter sp. ROC022 TaxID=2971796 RepID=UPI00215A1BC0|nr:hypothetical protein [Frigidibacter sp. ROC022]MCR8722768.1 hypothetical protein [Frigidibacter sp. ROC022]
MSLPLTRSADQELVHKSAQRLRWFVRAFETQLEETEAETNNRFTLDRAALAAVFAEWLRAFEAQKPVSADDKQAYVGFAAGLMLRTLITRKPVTLQSCAEGADRSNPAYFWPEGYLYVTYCLNVRGTVLKNDFHHEQHNSPTMDEIRTWWSFRENVEQDPSLAIAFLDLFAGDEPEWTMPELFRSGKLSEIASRFYPTPTIDGAH